MEVILLIVSILLIVIVLLQSGKAESAGQIVQGGNSELFSNRKERGIELFISRLTFVLGFTFFALGAALGDKSMNSNDLSGANDNSQDSSQESSQNNSQEDSLKDVDLSHQAGNPIAILLLSLLFLIVIPLRNR